MTHPVIDEAALAIAASLCLIARDRDGKTRRHPRRCAWCDWPEAELRARIAGFNAWADRNEDKSTYGRHDARVFNELPRTRQAELVREAQDFEPEPEPMRPPEPPPVDEQEVPSWL